MFQIFIKSICDKIPGKGDTSEKAILLLIPLGHFVTPVFLCNCSLLRRVYPLREDFSSVIKCFVLLLVIHKITLHPHASLNVFVGAYQICMHVPLSLCVCVCGWEWNEPKDIVNKTTKNLCLVQIFWLDRKIFVSMPLTGQNGIKANK